MHRKAIVDEWGRPGGFKDVPLTAKVVEEQKLIKNAKGEEVHSIVEAHLEGPHLVGMTDEFVYRTQLGQEIKFRPQHIEVKKFLGTDDVKKVIVYG
ncbi:hypothetical protein [Sporosarcina saromensis]|uniref:hypothetical protein n=1 Tax=Sporosarcina saromensis TaxID=359365 RepID=UPI00295F05C4|nr:hypothetical protein [Sporosarcina saromensis]